MTRAHTTTVVCLPGGGLHAWDDCPQRPYAWAFELADGRAAILPLPALGVQPAWSILCPSLAAAWTDLLACGRDAWTHAVDGQDPADLRATLAAIAPRAVQRKAADRQAHPCAALGCQRIGVLSDGSGSEFYCADHYWDMPS